jgi:hypothetical protein
VASYAGRLILVSHPPAGPLEDAVEIPPLQAEAQLLEMTAGRTEHLSLSVTIGSHTATTQRFVVLGRLDLVSMAFKHDKAAGKFQPPAWFGPEVTDDPSYRPRSIALSGLPSGPAAEVTNAALHSLLDAIDDRDRETQPQPTPVARAYEACEPAFTSETEQDLDGLNIEDSVIRELARSLQPQGR